MTQSCPSGKMLPMSATLRLLRLVQVAMLGSIVRHAVIGKIAGPHPKTVEPGLAYIFSTLSVAVVGVIFVVRRTLVLRSAADLVANPDDAITLNHWNRLCCGLRPVRRPGLARIGPTLPRLQPAGKRSLLHRRLRALVLLRTEGSAGLPRPALGIYVAAGQTTLFQVLLMVVFCRIKRHRRDDLSRDRLRVAMGLLQRLFGSARSRLLLRRMEENGRAVLRAPVRALAVDLCGIVILPKDL